MSEENNKNNNEITNVKNFFNKIFYLLNFRMLN